MQIKDTTVVLHAHDPRVSYLHLFASDSKQRLQYLYNPKAIETCVSGLRQTLVTVLAFLGGHRYL
jgi:hypothetical protein